MQPSLFSQKEMRSTKRRKVYDANDKFPFGKWKGKKLATVAAFSPLYLEWWIRTKNIAITAQLKEALTISKTLSL